ncbi:pilus assembly protein TadG-related protein [Azospirillum sp. SYSU D00513]|uniref:pilus assembly protein TadG-related protein n=1 Tax=Azospirillum sp. SYSU D00513 TaxID=2812561 RepID=UPI001A971926|nr:pilus assembly protein TadG-related protein [Azospirillum sp. SYSU D00513]
MACVTRDRRGAVGIMFGLVMPVLIGFVALGTEVGSWYLERREMQTAADMAALGAAYDLLSGSGDEVDAAEREAERYGFGAGIADITVNTPPDDGPASGDEEAVEVILTRSVPLLFARLFADESYVITVRATAAVNSAGTACVLALDPTGSQALNISGNATVTTPGCVLAANSNSPTAIAVGGSADATVRSLTTVGGYSASDDRLTTDLPPRTNAPAVVDPYAGRSIPADGPCDATNYRSNQAGGGSITPGRYCSGMDFRAQTTVNFAPGTYIVDGGSFTVNGGATLTCTGCTGAQGVTIVLTGSGNDFATVGINGGANIALKAPGQGAYAGMLFFQDPAAPAGNSGNSYQNTINGGADIDLEGAFYFPNQGVSLSGNLGAGSGCVQLVARRVNFTGSSSLGSDCDDTAVETINAGGAIRLVE